jgi:hypothetical protein
VARRGARPHVDNTHEIEEARQRGKGKSALALSRDLMVDAVAAQTRRYQTVAISNGVPILGQAAAGMPIWQNNLGTLRLCLMNLDVVIEQIQVQV